MPGKKAPEQERRAELLQAAYRVATRERLAGLTTRAVAQEANVSSGLIFFHFGTREGLILALLDRVLATTVLAPQPRKGDGSTPAEQLISAVGRDVQRLPSQREGVALLVDYWVMGTRDPVVRSRIRTALEEYRVAYIPLAEAAISSKPSRYRDVTPEGLAAVATGYVEGCAMQLVIDPDRFDVDACLAALRALVLRTEEN
jgi:TetR/AcrR family transcriptional regulator, transcriptional repressor of bet genes